jgi:RNA polymerase sigma factor (sigma-70 family)
MRTEDGNIIRECINGDSASFGLLVDKYKASIFALAYSRLHNFQDAEDVTQEVFLKAYTNIRRLRQWDNFVVWLRSVTINLCKNKLREQTRRRDNVPIKQDMEALENASLDSYQEEQFSSWREEALDSLDKALDSLPEQYRQILTLHYLGGMKGEEISKFLSISHDTVRQRLSRARAMLKEEVLAMISTDYEQRKLSASFTFRIVEAVKKIRINPPSMIKGLPWGLSVGAGFLLIILSLGSHIQINLPDIALGLPMPSDMKILQVGEIPVEAVKVSTMTFLGNKGDGKGIMPDPKGQENAFFMAPQGEGEWTTKADMPTGRLAISCAEVNGKIYAIGGASALGVYSPKVEEYDPKLDKWTKKADMNTNRHAVAVAELNGKIYAIGGYNNSRTISSIEEYDPINDAWTNKAAMPGAKAYHSAIAVNNMIYVLGGWADLDNNIPSLSVLAYDPAIDQWSKLKDIPKEFAIGGTAVIADDGRIYCFGGMNSNNNSMRKNVIVYDTQNETWSTKAELNTTRMSGVAAMIGRKVYFIGGAPLSYEGVSDVEEYDIDTNTIEKKTDMPHRRGWASGCAIDNRIFVIGGTTSWAGGIHDFLNIVEEFDPNSTSKSVNPSGKLPKTWGTIKAK